MNEADIMKENWERSFDEQIRIGAYNTAPVETIARHVSYYLREIRPAGDYAGLHFLEMGCGGGANLIWLAGRGIRVSGADISPTALKLCRRNFGESGLVSMLADLVESSVDRLPFPDGAFEGIIEACVFQHLEKRLRPKAFAEVGRLLKPGGVFCGY
ncbi:MAG: class I SAM-dependent methyltransferase, partial [Pseudomonadota bacterium]